MNKAFDGEKVVETKFGNLGLYQRFFDKNGEGYAKYSPSTCVDDYSLKEIPIPFDTIVFVKEK